MRLAGQAGIPFAPVNRPLDLIDDVHMRESGSLVEVQTPEGKLARIPGLPLRLAGAPCPVRHQPPGIGEGSLELYRQAGFSEEEISGLLSEGIIQFGPGSTT
jgi:crotonobetainyl-CoA:carnitine CoA-transferase CaiB-like acyl-CoA transferase